MPDLGLSRRNLLKLAASAPAGGVAASAVAGAVAASLSATGQGEAAALAAPGPAGNPAHFRFGIGQARVTVVSDGFFTTPVSGLGVNAERQEVTDFLRAHYLSEDSNYSHTNHAVIEIGEATVLVDVGSGGRFLPTAGRLMANLEAAGIDASAITHVVITHAHPDHIWGIRDDFDEAILPEADYLIGAVEHDYWMQDGLVDRVDPGAQQFVVGAVNSIETEGIVWTLAEDGHEVVPGLSMIATPGHTPGHMSLRLDSDGEGLIVLGDAMSHAYTNFSHPDWYNDFDMNGAQTVATRRMLLETAEAGRLAVLGYHFPFPGVGHVKADSNGTAWRFIPALWQFAG